MFGEKQSIESLLLWERQNRRDLMLGERVTRVSYSERCERQQSGLLRERLSLKSLLLRERLSPKRVLLRERDWVSRDCCVKRETETRVCCWRGTESQEFAFEEDRVTRIFCFYLQCACAQGLYDFCVLARQCAWLGWPLASARQERTLSWTIRCSSWTSQVQLPHICTLVKPVDMTEGGRSD